MEWDVLQSLLQEGGGQTQAALRLRGAQLPRDAQLSRPLGAEHAVRRTAAWLWVRLPWLGKGMECSGHKVRFEEREGRSCCAVLRHALRLSWRAGAHWV